MIDSTFYLLIYKISSLLVGTLSMYWGFKLFMNERWGDTGEIEGNIKEFKISFKRAAPGTFFSVFGAIIISFSIYKGFYTSSETKISENPLERYQNKIPMNHEKLPETPPN